jgi:hypothetical protein
MATEVKGWKSERTGKVFDTAAEATEDENLLDRAKLDKLKAHIASNRTWTPEVGDYIYVATHLYIDHGEDDVVGGIAQVTKVKPSMSGGDPNTLFVSVAQHGGNSYNWSQILVHEQGQWAFLDSVNELFRRSGITPTDIKRVEGRMEWFDKGAIMAENPAKENLRETLSMLSLIAGGTYAPAEDTLKRIKEYIDNQLVTLF